MPETISPKLATDSTDTPAVILVPIANLADFLPIWTRAINARAVSFASRADDPTVVEVTIGRGFATWKPGLGCWVPTLVQTYPVFPHWADSPSASI